jgi:hypothetical protein
VIGNATFVSTVALTVVALRRFGMSTRLWLRMIRVPLVAWAVVVAFATVLDIRNAVAVAVIATLFSILMIMWAVRPMAHGQSSWALMKRA